jgi:hypothetical protein
VTELCSLLAALASLPMSSSKGSIPKDCSSGFLQVVKADRSFAKVLRSTSGEVVVSVGPQLLLSQEINLLPMANRVELVVRSAWDCSKEDNGFSAPPQVKEAALGRRKKRKHLGFLSLGLGLGKLGLGFPGFVFRSGSGLVFGSGSGFGSVGPIFRLVSEPSVFSHQDLAKASMESSMVVNEQFRLEEAASMVFDGEEASSTMFDEHICLKETSTTVSNCSDDGLGSSTMSAFSNLANEGPGSSTVSTFSTMSSGYAKFDLTGAADSARKDSQAWFFGWLRAGVQHDERLLAKLEVIVENTSHANPVVPSLDRSKDMLLMQEELASLGVARRQDMAIAWVQALSGKGDM